VTDAGAFVTIEEDVRPVPEGEAITLRRVLAYGAPVLRQKAKPVDEPLDALRGLVGDMFETMFDEPGIGLAAPQVGVSKRLVVLAPVADDDAGENTGPRMVLVNPEVTWFSEDQIPYEEGCLSVPDITEVVERPRAIRFSYTDLDGKRLEMEAAGVLARVVQHEVDHLDGILFVDRLSLLKKQLLRKKLKQLAAAARS
jgi:peptide deformylase